MLALESSASVVLAVCRPILLTAAFVAAAIFAVLLLLIYKVLFVLTVAIGLATALFVERAEADRQGRARNEL